MALKASNMCAQPAVLEPTLLSLAAFHGFAIAPPPGLSRDPTLRMRTRVAPPPGLSGDLALPMKVELPVPAALPAHSSALILQREGLCHSPVAHGASTPGAATDSDHHTESSPTGTPSGTFSETLSDALLGACTTLAIMNIPYTYPVWKLQAELDAEGLPYDYLHFPKDSRKGRNRGFAFVNFTTSEAAQAFQNAFHNRLLAYPGDREKHVTVMPSSLQGFESNAKLHPFAAANTTAQLSRARGQGAGCRQSQRHGGKLGLVGTAPAVGRAMHRATYPPHTTPRK